MSTTTRHGFTLIELLVVISIIAILASMLLPAVGMIRDMANQQKCASNQRQFAMANIAYATDNAGLPVPYLFTSSNGQIPWCYNQRFLSVVDARLFNDGHGFDDTWGDLPNNLKCPNSDRDSTQWYKARIVYGYNLNSESMYNGDWSEASVDLPISKIISASNKVMFLDSDYESCWYVSWYKGPVQDDVENQGNWTWGAKYVARHRSKANFSFWDGHVEGKRSDQIGTQGSTTMESLFRLGK